MLMAMEKAALETTFKIPPQDLDAEKALLGSLLLHPQGIDEILDFILPETFYTDRHRAVYEAVLDLHKKSEPVDLLSVSTRLREKKELERVGGATYLSEMVEMVPSAANVKHYADIVQRKSSLRNLIISAEEVLELGYREQDDIDEIFDKAERKIFGLKHFSLKQKFTNIRDSLSDAWERLDLLHKEKGKLRGVPTGYPDLDNKLAGLQNSDLIILAARPSMGKTALALDIARQTATRFGNTVGIFSIEMSTQQLVDRLLAAEARVDSWKLRTGNLSSEDEFARIRDSLDRLAHAPIFIDDDPNATVMKMRAQARRLKSEHDLKLLIVDYLQLMIPNKQSDSLVQQVTEISRSLKALAREIDVPVLALSQLNRAIETRRGLPRLSDLRDSGSIEQDADVVMFIHKEDKEGSERNNIAKIIIAKHRNGPTGEVELYFDEKRVSFTTIEKGS